MISIVGMIIVASSIVVGYLLEGGHMDVLIQPVEILIIAGAAGGSLVVSSPMPLLKAIVRQLIGIVKSKGPTKQDYMELLLLLFELCKTAKANPLAIEAHVDNPENSEIFKRYPGVLSKHHAINFLADTLKVQLSAAMSPYDLEELMDKDIEAEHKEEFQAPATVGRMGDAMPGLGIVAAVLGVVITMGKLSQGKAAIGHSVAAALIGTFMGVLGCYGFIQPLAARMELNLNQESQYYNVIKACLIAYAKNCSPKVCVEFARRTIAPGDRPSFLEVDQATSGGGAKKAA